MPKHAISIWYRLGFSFNSGSFCVVVAFGSSPVGGPWVITLLSVSVDWPSSGTSLVDREDGVFVCESGGVGSMSYSCTLRRFRSRVGRRNVVWVQCQEDPVALLSQK